MAKLVMKVITYQEVDIDEATDQELDEIKEAVNAQDMSALQSLSFYESEHYSLETDPDGETILEAWIEE